MDRASSDCYGSGSNPKGRLRRPANRHTTTRHQPPTTELISIHTRPLRARAAAILVAAALPFTFAFTTPRHEPPREVHSLSISQPQRFRDDVLLEASTTTTTSSSTTTTAAPAPPPPPPTTTTTAPPPPPPPPPPPAPAPKAGACGGWEDTIAAYFPADQVAKGCAVIGCETGYTYDPTKHNPSSSASGLWQFLDSTWENTTGTPAPAANYSADTQTAAAAQLWRSSGWSQWSCA